MYCKCTIHTDTAIPSNQAVQFIINGTKLFEHIPSSNTYHFKTKGEIRTTSERIKTSRKTDSVRTSPWQKSLHWINYMGCYGVYNYYTDYKPWIRFVGCTSKYRTMLPKHVFLEGGSETLPLFADGKTRNGPMNVSPCLETSSC